MKRKSFADSPCQIARSLDVLGDWWNPLIIRECLYGVRRFDEFQHWLGIGRNILTRRLNLLIREGLLEKRIYQSKPKRYEYALTEKGYDAAKVLLAMMEFGGKWHFEQGKEPIRLYDRQTNERVHPTVVDSVTKREVNARDLYGGPGSGFPKSDAVRRERFVEYFKRNPPGVKQR